MRENESVAVGWRPEQEGLESEPTRSETLYMAHKV